jgi:hypothetical protein
MTEHYDVERTITSLGIGEALVTVLSPKGVPTPLAATRLIPPDSRMDPLTEAELAQVIAGSQLHARYGTPVDRESAHEIISGRLANAKAAAEAAAAQAGATVPGGGTMTPAQYERAMEKQARERAREIERERKAAERERKARERAAQAAERQRQRTIETAIRTGGRVATSRIGQSVLRGVFDTIFGGGRR